MLECGEKEEGPERLRDTYYGEEEGYLRRLEAEAAEIDFGEPEEGQDYKGTC